MSSGRSAYTDDKDKPSDDVERQRHLWRAVEAATAVVSDEYTTAWAGQPAWADGFTQIDVVRMFNMHIIFLIPPRIPRTIHVTINTRLLLGPHILPVFHLHFPPAC